MKLYLAGPINGRSDDECITWRREVARKWPCEVLDPMRRDFRGSEGGNSTNIVEGDKRDIDECDGVLVYYPGPSAGTCMEILYAYMARKPVIVWNNTGDELGPWVRYHAKAVAISMDRAIHRAVDILEERRNDTE